MTRPIFIVGCPRSGTGILRDLLRSHPNLTFPGESHFIARFYRAYGDPASPREARMLASRIAHLRWVRAWELDLDPASFEHHRRYCDLVADLFGRWAAREGKPRWGDKTPRYVFAVPTLLELFPDARVIHIHRDGRDVASSWVRRNYGPTNVHAAARAWVGHVSAGLAAGERAGPERYLDVGYERLMADPEPELRRVCEFVGEPFRQEVLAPELDAARAGAWRAGMSRADQALFEAVGGDLLERLGYARATRATAPGRLSRAAWSARDASGQLLVGALSEGRRARLQRNVQLWAADLRASFSRRASCRSARRPP